jgi:acyl-CoA dehydrogenase
VTLDSVLAAPAWGYFGPDHDLVRASTRAFAEREIAPSVDRWEEEGAFPRELYAAAGAVGILGIGYPEGLGGTPGDLFMQIAVWEELIRPGSGGVSAGLGSLHIALPPILRHGTEEQQERFIPPVLAGERIAALCITEPGAGSDVASLTTTARRDGAEWVVDGAKTFITSGVRADQLTVAVRTGGGGHGGISLLVVPGDAAGLVRSSPMKKMGWWASDTATLFFDQVRVPAANLIGEENAGFAIVMENFQAERLQMSVVANMTAELALLAAASHATERRTFGKSLSDHQVIGHKLADMATEVFASKETTYRVAARMAAGIEQTVEVSMAKNVATAASHRVTDAAVQIFGGYGYMREYLVERLYRDSRILSIGGGTTEIMKEIIARRIL